MEILFFLIKAYFILGVCVAVPAFLISTSMAFKEFHNRNYPRDDWNMSDTILTVLMCLFFWPFVLWQVHKELKDD